MAQSPEGYFIMVMSLGMIKGQWFILTHDCYMHLCGSGGLAHALSTSSHLDSHVCLMESTLDIRVSQLVFMTLSCQSQLMGGVAEKFQPTWQEKLIRLSSMCWELSWQKQQNILYSMVWRCLEKAETFRAFTWHLEERVKDHWNTMIWFEMSRRRTLH